MTMTMQTNLRGRLRNTSLPGSHGLLPLFETVVNSIHALEEAGVPTDDSCISVEIIRSGQQEMAFDNMDAAVGRAPEKAIEGFKVTDNGPGFNQVNMASFMTLDSEYKAEKGGRGVGRLLWLKAFQSVEVASAYRDEDGDLKYRRFLFTAERGVEDIVATGDSPGPKRSTSVYLNGFKQEYRDRAAKTAAKIAESLLEHCLWYFVRDGSAPHIEVVDAGSRINLDEEYEKHMLSSAETDQVKVRGTEFDLTHVKLRTNSSGTHTIAYCAARQVVMQENIAGKIPGLFGRLRDDKDDFLYACYVRSPYLDEKVRSERTSFDISEHADGLLAQTEITLGEIKEAVLVRARGHLSQYLESNLQVARSRLEDFVAKKAPGYRPILRRLRDSELNIDPNASDKEMDVFLHKHQFALEQRLLDEGHDVLRPRDDESGEDYQARVQEYLNAAEDVKMANLAAYVAHRRVILDLFEAALKRKVDGRYSREDLLHSLIMPMGHDSNDIEFDRCNLWIIDERLAFHDYLASDKPLSSIPVTGSVDGKEPDLIALRTFDQPILVSERKQPPLASIVVVEFKRPMRNDAAEGEDKDPIEQAVGYLKRVRDGEVRTPDGRPIPDSHDIPGYCYVVCDITERVKRRCVDVHDLTRTSDGLGFFGYKKNLKAYVEVISFDGLLDSAKMRNRAFFDKLGLPTT